MIYTTILFIGIFTLIQIPLTVMVGFRRVQTGIPFMDGGVLTGRLMHAAILVVKGWGLPRAIGMILTFIPMAVFGGWCVFKAVA